MKVMFPKLTNTEMCSLAVQVMEEGWHLPIKDGKCNAENVDEQIFMKVYSGEWEPLLEEDIHMVCGLIDSLIEEYGDKQ